MNNDIIIWWKKFYPNSDHGIWVAELPELYPGIYGYGDTRIAAVVAMERNIELINTAITSIGSVFNGNVCEDNDCGYIRDCANHSSAGDFRSEGGSTPDVKLIDGKIVCSKTIRVNGCGMVCLRDGRLMIYGGPYPGDGVLI